MKPSGPSSIQHQNEKVQKSWAKQAPQYDKRIGCFERRVFGRSHRPWACKKASGKTLEVAVGTALNLDHYPDGIELTGLDLSPEMLEIARERSTALDKAIDLREGDAHNLPFDTESFDTVVCTYSLCNIPDPQKAVDEMKRVLKPGGKLVLVDHIRAASKPVYWLQKVMEFLTSRLEGEHMTRRPADQVERADFEIVERDRMGFAGIVERLVAIKQSTEERSV